jgi:hypothetical protein
MAISDDHNWILVLRPMNEFKIIAGITSILWIIFLLILFIGWNDYSWQDHHLIIRSGSIGVLLFAMLLPTALFSLFTVMAYSLSIEYIAIEENDLFVKYAINRVLKSPWTSYQKLSVFKWKKKYPDESDIPTEITTISLKLGHKNYVVFAVYPKTADKIIALYESKTGKKAEMNLNEPQPPKAMID